ncbi:MAG: LysM peptidoglycan-binding domain-containing protein [Chloroflexi bacterium]|nr:LysM peptidoglycan-binding domain-containing protein [Chloroflexota bacterium]
MIYQAKGCACRCSKSAPAPWYPPVGAQYYYVQPGDTLFRIGARFGVNIYRIAEANRLLNLNLIYAGVPLYIPR